MQGPKKRRNLHVEVLIWQPYLLAGPVQPTGLNGWVIGDIKKIKKIERTCESFLLGASTLQSFLNPEPQGLAKGDPHSLILVRF